MDDKNRNISNMMNDLTARAYQAEAISIELSKLTDNIDYAGENRKYSHAGALAMAIQEYMTNIVNTIESIDMCIGRAINAPCECVDIETDAKTGRLMMPNGSDLDLSDLLKLEDMTRSGADGIYHAIETAFCAGYARGCRQVS